MKKNSSFASVFSTRLHLIDITRLLKKTALASLITLAAVSSASASGLSFISLDVAPWASINPQTGENEGAFVEIVRELERRLDEQLEITVTPLARVERELMAGTSDCTILIPLPDELVVKGDVVASHDIGFMSRKGVPITRYEDLKSLKISVIRGGVTHTEFDHDESLHKEFDTDYLMGLRKVARGRLDAIVGAIPTLQHLVRQESLEHLFEEPFTMMEIPLYFQCSRQSPNLDQMAKVNRILMDIKADGTLEKIRKQFHF